MPSPGPRSGLAKYIYTNGNKRAKEYLGIVPPAPCDSAYGS